MNVNVGPLVVEVTPYQATVTTRTYFSRFHLTAGPRFCKMAATIEQLDAKERRHKMDEHRALVMSAIFSCVAFMEAAINELYADIADDVLTYVKPLPASVRTLMKGLWAWPKFEASDTLRKYQVALLCAGLPEFEEGSNPFQRARLVIRLRNDLVHPRPVTFRGESPQKHRIAIMLQSERFAPNPLVATRNAFFPHECLGVGCAEWAIKACRDFADEFFCRLNIHPAYKPVAGKR